MDDVEMPLISSIAFFDVMAMPTLLVSIQYPAEN